MWEEVYILLLIEKKSKLLSKIYYVTPFCKSVKPIHIDI